VLVPDIQVCRRFVQDEQPRCLRQRASNQDTLLFSSGKAVELTLLQRCDADVIERCSNNQRWSPRRRS
jgi:hypothetical protein